MTTTHSPTWAYACANASPHRRLPPLLSLDHTVDPRHLAPPALHPPPPSPVSSFILISPAPIITAIAPAGAFPRFSAYRTEDRRRGACMSCDAHTGAIPILLTSPSHNDVDAAFHARAADPYLLGRSASDNRGPLQDPNTAVAASSCGHRSAPFLVPSSLWNPRPQTPRLFERHSSRGAVY